jgi:hypothetical protein
VQLVTILAFVMCIALNLFGQTRCQLSSTAKARSTGQQLSALSARVGCSDGSSSGRLDTNQGISLGMASSTGISAYGQAAGRPAAFDQCGRWQEAYIERHRKIVAGELPPKYLVAVLHDAGVADQLLGAVAAFYWALVRDVMMWM